MSRNLRKMSRTLRELLSDGCQIAAWALMPILVTGCFLIFIGDIPSVEDVRPSGDGLWGFVTNWTVFCTGGLVVLGFFVLSAFIEPRDDR